LGLERSELQLGYLKMTKTFNVVRYQEFLKLEENGEISFLDLELLSFKASVAQQLC